MKTLSRLIVAAALFLVPAPLAKAHEGHDHETIAPPTNAAVPTLEADGSDVQIVALLRGQTLILFVDRLADNSPVTGAAVTVAVDGGPAMAVPVTPDGTYQAAAPWAKPGDHALNFVVTGDGLADLLVGTLTVPVASGEVRAGMPWGVVLLPVATFIGGLLLGAVLKIRRGTRLLLILLLLLPVQRVRAHEGHDHAEAVEHVAGNGPSRLPDGSLFVPKATQRLLSVRTQVLESGELLPMVALTGRVIADPGRSGRVQAPQSGRLVSPEGGFPLPGTAVTAGQVLGYVELLLRPEDGSNISQQLAALEKEIRLAQQQWSRLSALKGTVAQAAIDDARTSLDGLTRQREALARAVARRVPLTSPIDGVVTVSNAIQGLVIEDRDVTILFEVAAPGALLVEAQSFAGPLPAGTMVTAGLNGRDVPLALVGQGIGMAPGATRLLLRVGDGGWGGTLPAIGTLLTLSLPDGGPVTGLLLPREALVRGADGLPAVMLRETAQHFIPRTVRVEPAGAAAVRLLAGVEAGDRIVVQGAPLLAQIR